MGRLAGRIALVTGCSEGIGRAIARRYATEGAHVILLARTQNRLQSLYDEIVTLGGTASIIVVDITDFVSIKALAVEIAMRFRKLDILVLNAAIIGDLMPLAHMEMDMWDAILRTNLTANWHLLQCFDSLLKSSSKGGRVIAVTSGVAKSSRPFFGAYATSKIALEMLIKTYAAEVENTKIRANLVDPGIVATNMRAKVMPGEDASTLPSPDSITDAFVYLAEDNCVRNGTITQAYYETIP